MATRVKIIPKCKECGGKMSTSDTGYYCSNKKCKLFDVDYPAYGKDIRKWVEAVLVNDEYSGYKELLEYFTAAGLPLEEARFYLSQRDEALRDPIGFELQPWKGRRG